MTDDHVDAVAELADRYGRMVFATAYRVLGNAEDAEDAFQEVFLRLLGTRNGHVKPDAVRDWGGYLRVTASRCAVDLLRRKSKWKQNREELSEAIDAWAAGNSPPAAARRQKAELLRQALAGLPKRDARVFALRYFEDASYRQIAAQMDLSVNQVGVILHRGRRRLREILEPMVGGVSPSTGKTRDIGSKTAKGQ